MFVDVNKEGKEQESSHQNCKYFLQLHQQFYSLEMFCHQSSRNSAELNVEANCMFKKSSQEQMDLHFLYFCRHWWADPMPKD